MGFSFSKITQKVTKGVQNAAQAIGAVGSLPVQAGFQSIAQTAPAAAQAIGGVGQVAGQATQVLQENPALAGVLTSGLTGGGWNLGSLIPSQAMGNPGPSPSYAPPSAAAPSVPVWVWIVGGVGALLAVVLFIRK